MNVFLIDADNLNSGAWVDEAFRALLEVEGSLPVRRAYGSADNLKALADTLCAWAVRPFVNLAQSKNTTDMALAVDAMELALQTPRPDLMVIGSGDADFLPLVVRLRERGIRLVCVSERSKMAREATAAYDRVLLVGPEHAAQDLAASTTGAALPGKPSSKTVAKKTSSKQRTVAPAPADPAVVKVTAAKKVAAKKPSTGKKAALAKIEPMPVLPSPSQLPALDVAAILQAVPALQGGQPQPLAAVAKALLDTKLRGKNTTATKLLKKFPHHFALLPTEKPRTVSYMAAPDAS